MSALSQNQTKAQNDDSVEATAAPKKRDRSASEDKLMAAGIDVFSEFGYDGSTTKMIAQKAGVNEALIARYFEGKQGLLIAIMQRFIVQIHDEELPFPPQETLAAELKSYFDFKVCQDDKEKECLGKILITQAMTDSAFKKKFLAQVPMEADQRLLDRLQILKNNKKIAPDVKIQDICEEVETYMHGLFITEVILFEMPKEKLTERVYTFIEHYSRGLER